MNIHRHGHMVQYFPLHGINYLKPIYIQYLRMTNPYKRSVMIMILKPYLIWSFVVSEHGMRHN
nr:MAG TPA: hypothetical protein [Caudoviricetes sp.]